ncbi:TetR/AcrR family transcriptional regulator [Kutzneria kofuensis]|jgi:TetR/AcrR family transcriptional repressor of nem operon|uniref:TetR/AcrR family transcriptional repressor of nem operon n=1 Tax=Kutzneria kofuensis TaxID=103725 RepID=A0A7W9NET5_9PSEU|nr:TetR/AcrR family transcriptional regulator [Kutzneria kofuensis]MBB5889283.1 TetR/AcrR family transcriptional repressor of nem operon [Kutzneria kofuensis]
MARTKEFDPDVALRAALDLFWRQGYEATSMQDLVDHLGIARASIYATFGSKNELYLRALERYSQDLGVRYLSQLSGPGPLAAVRALMASAARDAVLDPDRKGCFITNTAVECPAVDGAEALVDGGFNGLQAMLAGALVRARDEGELSPDKDPQALARFLVTFLQGLRVMAHHPDERRITDALDQALSLLA